MTVNENFSFMADYNRWMNRNVYGAAAKLSQEELTADRGAFFKSILGTLNHLLVADLLWLQRFAAHPAHFKALEPVTQIEKPSSLDQILHPALQELRSVRVDLDATIISFIDELDEAALDSTLVYANYKGTQFKRKLSWLLLHFFNHQTHHRGQISTLLFQQGIDVGVTDLPAILPEVRSRGLIEPG